MNLNELGNLKNLYTSPLTPSEKSLLQSHLSQLESLNDEPLNFSRSNSLRSFDEENLDQLIEDEFIGLDKEDLERAALLYQDV